MQFSVCLACNSEFEPFIEQVKRLDDHGYHYLWLTDLGLKAMDVFAFLTLAANHSSRIKIAAGVHPPQLRHPAVTLNMLVTLEAMAEGRIAYGIGTGAQALVQAVGQRPLNLKSVRELISLSRRLMAGETVSSCTQGLIMNDAALARTPAASLPIYLAATGPKTLALAGEVADGVIAHVGGAPETIRAALLSSTASAEQRMCPKPLDFTPYLYACVAARREDAITACARGARTVAFRAPHLAAAAGCSAQQVERLRRGDETADDILTDAFVDKLTLSGTVGDCVAKLEAMSELGIDHVTLYLRGDDISAQIETFGREILPRFQ
jgi:5,10-methylenetetrahydromethanopterin reductase